MILLVYKAQERLNWKTRQNILSLALKISKQWSFLHRFAATTNQHSIHINLDYIPVLCFLNILSCIH